VILVDTSGLLAALDESQLYHAECAAVLRAATPPLFLSPFVLAELDYLLARYIGRQAQTALLAELERRAYQLEPFNPADVARGRELVEKYSSLEIGLADASIVVLAERHAVKDVLTLDQRHFRTLRIGRSKRFRILPFDQ
jgi:predicted nucleic acid-binding protein